MTLAGDTVLHTGQVGVGDLTRAEAVLDSKFPTFMAQIYCFINVHECEVSQLITVNHGINLS